MSCEGGIVSEANGLSQAQTYADRDTAIWKIKLSVAMNKS